MALQCGQRAATTEVMSSLLGSKAMGSTIMLTMLSNIEENGRMISQKVSVPKGGQMGTCLRGSSKMDIKMGKVNSHGIMAHLMKGILK